MNPFLRDLAAGTRAFLSRLSRRGARRTAWEELRIPMPDGRRIYAHLHRPVGSFPCPGVVFVPGGISPGTDYDRAREITADDVAADGFLVLHYDPAGRGRTGGDEDRWGPVHQEELARVVDFFSKVPLLDPAGLGIVSFSIGIATAAGALAKFPMPVRFLFDWEGPSNRHNITLHDTFEPFREFPTTDDSFWEEREPARFIGRIPCGYFRYQAETDHMQGRYKGHAMELINRATRGKAAWTRCNDNPPNTVFDERCPDAYRWIPDRRNDRSGILSCLRAALEESRGRR